MLVLSAAYYNTWLKTFVDAELFKGRLTRTIGFLRRLAPISPTCKIDCYILESIEKCLFGPGEQKHIYHNEVEPTSGPHSISGSFGAVNT
jgi:hypothetical protein